MGCCWRPGSPEHAHGVAQVCSSSLQTLREEQANLDLLLRRVNAGSVIGERNSCNGETRGKPAFGASINERLHGWVGR